MPKKNDDQIPDAAAEELQIDDMELEDSEADKLKGGGAVSFNGYDSETNTWTDPGHDGQWGGSS